MKILLALALLSTVIILTLKMYNLEYSNMVVNDNSFCHSDSHDNYFLGRFLSETESLDRKTLNTDSSSTTDSRSQVDNSFYFHGDFDGNNCHYKFLSDF